MFGQTKPGSTDIGIKKANQYEMVTRDEYIRRAKLMHKSRKDIVWWAENFFHIVTMDKGLTKIKLYEKQKELLQFMCSNNRTIVLSARQCGKCSYKDTKVTIRNKQTGKVEEITINELINRIK